jgi:hypothetical protein
VVNRLFDLLMYVEDNHSGFVWDVVRMIIFMGVLAYGLLTVATAIGVVTYLVSYLAKPSSASCGNDDDSRCAIFSVVYQACEEAT